MSTEAKIKHPALDEAMILAHVAGATSRLGSLHEHCRCLHAGDFGLEDAEDLIRDISELLADLRRNRRLLEAGERLRDAAQSVIDDDEFARKWLDAALAAYQEAAKS